MRKALAGIIFILLFIIYAAVVSPWLLKERYQYELPVRQLSSYMYFEKDKKVIYNYDTGSETGILPNFYGALEIGFHLATPWLRGWRTTWGGSDNEIKRFLPGDGMVPESRWTYTHAITIEAPRSAVWPWLMQIGQRRGGFYSYQGLENLAGCRITNTDRVADKFFTLKPGELVYLHPDMPPLTVAAIRRGYWIVLRNTGDLTGNDHEVQVTWAFYLQRISEYQTRLLVRGRSNYPDGFATRIQYGPTLVEPIGFVMSKKMMKGIKARAEGWLAETLRFMNR